MSEHRERAIRYLRMRVGALWRWEEDGRVLVWQDGTTLAFRDELVGLLSAVAPAGLPPFEGLVLVLAACRGRLPLPSDLATKSAASAERVEVLATLQARHHQKALEDLRSISRLPSELIRGVRGKALLVDAVFERTQRLSREESAQIVEALSEDVLGMVQLATPEVGGAAVDWVLTVWMVVEGLRNHSGESLQRRLRTGLDELPEAAEPVSLPPEVCARRVLAELSAGDDYPGIAVVARDLMAAIRLPRVVATIDELALGGASGVGNRGSLDRLLVSELAQDDLILATRVALHEALYVLREPPALTPDRGLVLLLDVGLRQWGVPRVISVAAALGLIAGYRGTGAVQVWRAEGALVEAVQFDSTQAWERHLAALRLELDPGAALPALLREMARGDQGSSDVVVVVHRDTMNDGGFAACLASASFERGFILLVDHDGRVELHAMPWGSPRPIAQTCVEVSRLFPRKEGKDPEVSLMEPLAGRELPRVFREPIFPLLLPVSSQLMVVTVGAGGLAVTKDKRLMRWSALGLGAQQIAADLPSGQVRWLFGDSKGRNLVVKFHHGRSQVVVLMVSVEDGTSKVTNKQVQFSSMVAPRAFYVHGDQVYFVLKSSMVVLGIEPLAVLAETPIPAGLAWHHGRFFFGPGGVSFAYWSGECVRWDSAVAGRGFSSSDVLLVFEYNGVGAYVLMRDGRLLSPSGSEIMSVGDSLSSAQISEDGTWIMATRLAKRECVRMDLAKRSVEPLHVSSKAVPLLGRVQVPSMPLRHNFKAIAGSPGRPLSLLTNKGGWVDFTLSGKRLRMVERISGSKAPEGDHYNFTGVTTPAFFGCSLSVAVWPCGSRAWLDSRGLLHLRSCEATLPEICLTITGAELAVWTSDGRMGGAEFFTGSQSGGLSHGEAAALLKEFTVRLC